MKCTNCGKMVPDSAKICGYCGHRLKSEIGPAAVFQTPSAGESNKKPRNKWMTGLLIGAGIVIVGLIVAIIFMLTRPKPTVQTKLPDENANAVSGQGVTIEPVVETDSENSANSTNSNCIDRAVMIDETIPDGTQMNPGETFTKTWRFRNNGTCTWTTQYSLSMNSGHDLENEGYPNLQSSVAPGGEIEVSVNMTAPQTPGTYESHWVLNNAAGKSFGVGSNGDEAVWVSIDVVTTQADRCPLFTGLKIELAYLDWTPGSALTFYLTVPGGVPGLEKQIPSDIENWVFSARIGDYTGGCDFEGYKEMLFCTVALPEGYSNTKRDLTVSVNRCNAPIFSQNPAYLPKIAAASSSNGTACSQPGSNVDNPTNSVAWEAYCKCIGKSEAISGGTIHCE